MWTTVLTLCISKTSWIFLFIILYITVFIIITSNDDGKELKERLKRSQCEVKCVEKVLNDIENKTWTCRSRYKSLMNNLKMDVQKTEQEIEFLQSQVFKLSHRREELKKEVVKQQEEYERMLNHFTKDLESKGIGCGT